MRAWAALLGGLLLWAGHFLALYAIGSLFPGQAMARWLVLGATGAVLAALGWLGLRTASRIAAGGDPFDRWMNRTALLAAAMGGTGIVFQGLTAAF